MSFVTDIRAVSESAIEQLADRFDDLPRPLLAAIGAGDLAVEQWAALRESVIEQMAVIGYKELNESGEFTIPGFAKFSVVKKPATEARTGINPFTKEPMEFKAKPASKTVKAQPLKVAKDAV